MLEDGIPRGLGKNDRLEDVETITGKCKLAADCSLDQTRDCLRELSLRVQAEYETAYFRCERHNNVGQLNASESLRRECGVCVLEMSGDPKATAQSLLETMLAGDTLKEMADAFTGGLEKALATPPNDPRVQRLADDLAFLRSILFRADFQIGTIGQDSELFFITSVPLRPDEKERLLEITREGKLIHETAIRKEASISDRKEGR